MKKINQWRLSHSLAGTLVTVCLATANPAAAAVLEATSQTLTQTDGAAVALGDIDYDGDIDAIVTGDWDSGGEYATQVWINDGTGNFTQDTGHSLTSANDIALVYIDNDRYLDAVVHHTDYDSSNPLMSPSEFRVWMNNGSGKLSDLGQAYGHDTDAYGAVAVEDLTGDGNDDLFAGHKGAANHVFTIDSAGNLTDVGATPGTASTGAVALGDVDGDGDADAVVANQGFDDELRVRLNDGSGAFSDSGQSLTHPDGNEPHDVALADVDTDSDLDVIAVYDNGGSTRIWLNDGSGNFSDSGTALSHTGEATSLVVADVDNSYRNDLVIGTTDVVQLWMGDGAGQFTLVQTVDLMAEDLAVNDLNTDGYSDVFVVAYDSATGQTQNTVLLSTRQFPDLSSGGGSSGGSSGGSGSGSTDSGGGAMGPGLLAVALLGLVGRRRRYR